jgi:hypothetical protein
VLSVWWAGIVVHKLQQRPPRKRAANLPMRKPKLPMPKKGRGKLMALLYRDIAEERLTQRRIDAEKRLLDAKFRMEHGRTPTKGELINLVWNSKMEPGNGQPILAFGEELYEEKE